MIKKLNTETNKPTGYPILEMNFRMFYSNMGLPEILTPKDVEKLGWCLFETSPQPTLERYEKAIEGDDIKDENGIWRQNWIVAPQTDVEKAATDAKQEQLMRNNRQIRLVSSDWTQLPDAPISIEKKQEWIIYRQALRDITNSTSFPWDIIWPTAPNK